MLLGGLFAQEKDTDSRSSAEEAAKKEAKELLEVLAPYWSSLLTVVCTPPPLRSPYTSFFGELLQTGGGKSGGGRVAGAAKPKGKVAVKFHNAVTGDNWSGRGLQPRWLKAALAAGAKITDFAV